MGFGVWGVGFGVQGLGCGVWGWGLRCRVLVVFKWFWVKVCTNRFLAETRVSEWKSPPPTDNQSARVSLSGIRA